MKKVALAAVLGFVLVSSAQVLVAAQDPPSEGAAATEAETTVAPISLEQWRQAAGPTPWYQRLTSAFGLLVMVGLAWTVSTDRKRFPWRIALWGVGLQLAFGLFILKTPVGLWLFQILNDVVHQLLAFTDAGSRFLFGNYLDSEFTVALNVLPTIIFFSSLMGILYHLRLVQPVVRGVAWVMQKTLRTSGAETLSAAANIFVGQTEAPLVIRPFVATMTRSELMAVMTGGFATVAGGVMAAYVQMLESYFPDIAGHLIAASVMSAPAALVIAKVMVPESEQPQTLGALEMNEERPHVNVVDAAAGGASDGLKLALNVAAMLLAFLALVALFNYLFGLPALFYNQHQWAMVTEALSQTQTPVPDGCGAPQGAAELARCIGLADPLVEEHFNAWTPWTLEGVLGVLFWPIAFVMGAAPADCSAFGNLLGQKLILNEFVAYQSLAQSLSSGEGMSPRSAVIATYALCGFANIGSIGIQIGGIGTIAPERRGDLAKIGVRAMFAGTLAAFMTACVAGLLI